MCGMLLLLLMMMMMGRDVQVQAMQPQRQLCARRDAHAATSKVVYLVLMMGARAKPKTNATTVGIGTAPLLEK